MGLFHYIKISPLGYVYSLYNLLICHSLRKLTFNHTLVYYL